MQGGAEGEAAGDTGGIDGDRVLSEEGDDFFRTLESLCLPAFGAELGAETSAARRGERLLSTCEIDAIFVTCDKTVGIVDVSYLSAIRSETGAKGGE